MNKSPTCFDATESHWVKTTVLSKQVGDFFQILWPSHNVWTLEWQVYLQKKRFWPQCVYYTVAQVCIVVCHLQQLKAHWRIWHVTNKKCRLLGVAKNSGKHCSKLLSYISKKAPIFEPSLICKICYSILFFILTSC